MKRNIASLAFFVAVTIALATRASAQEQPFQANVPFAFTVGDRQLPLGSYRIKSFGTTQVQIENLDQEVFVSALGMASSKSRDENKKTGIRQSGRTIFSERNCLNVDSVGTPEIQFGEESPNVVEAIHR